jgi:DNA-binding PadR family transcriptional regulator
MTDTLTRDQLKRIALEEATHEENVGNLRPFSEAARDALDELVSEGLSERLPDTPGWKGWYRITDAGRAAQKATVQG